ncbi:MAG TPA: SDR family oxidoreductase [Bacteriovoracaceae bacterium]|nr:SDR family oxidoreductase [Bacteriovoracaceae bacterium]
MEQTQDRPLAKDIHGQKLPYPAKQSEMVPRPADEMKFYKAANKLEGKIALITGADSGIGRSVAVAYAMEGADLAIVYNVNDEDALRTKELVESHGRSCLLIKGDVRTMEGCKSFVQKTIEQYGQLDILVNNAAYQKSHAHFKDVTEEEIRRTFETNIFGYMFMAQSALPYLKKGSCIINTGSIVGLVGLGILVPYTATKAAIHAFTKSLALNLGEEGIRVNCVVPGPIWTPNIPATMPIEEVENFGHEVALKRPGQPEEVAPVYVFLASLDSSFVTGALYEVTGGRLSPG